LTGVHEAGGHDYLVKEPFEELIWWLQLPALLRLASHSEPNRPAAAAIAKAVEDAVVTVATAGYQTDRLLALRSAQSEQGRRHPNRQGTGEQKRRASSFFRNTAEGSTGARTGRGEEEIVSGTHHQHRKIASP
jgi:hypothetical protein